MINEFLFSYRDVLVEKHYRGLLTRQNTCDYFWDEVRKCSSIEEANPIIATPKYTLIHVQREGLFFLAIVGTDVTPLLVIEFLHRCADVFAQYFTKLEEKALKEHLMTVYQVYICGSHLNIYLVIR
jgi:hypothetical protein